MGSDFSSFRYSRDRIKANRTTQAGGFRPSLLSLPPELRNKIYAYALSSPSGYISFYSAWQPLSRDNQIVAPMVMRPYPATPPVPQPRRLHKNKSRSARKFLRNSLETADRLGLPLLETCKQIHAEAIHYLYSSNIFVIPQPLLLCLSIAPWPSKLFSSSHCLHRIQSVQISVDYSTTFNPFQSYLNSLAKALEYLRLCVAIVPNSALTSITVSFLPYHKGPVFEPFLSLTTPRLLEEWSKMLKEDRERWAASDGAILREEFRAKNQSSFEEKKGAVVIRKLELLGRWQAFDLSMYGLAITQLRDAFGGEIWVRYGLYVSSKKFLAMDEGR